MVRIDPVENNIFGGKVKAIKREINKKCSFV